MRSFKGSTVFALLLVVGVIAIAWLVMMSSQTEKVPSEVRDLKRIRAGSIVDNFKDGGQFCTRPQNQTSNCSGVSTLMTVNADGVTVQTIFGEPFSSKTTFTQRYYLKDNTICVTPSDAISTMVGYRTNDDLAKISDNDKVGTSDQQKEIQALVRLKVEDGRESCSSYWAAPSDDHKNRMVMVEYIDGVLQPFDPDSTAVFFTSDSKLQLY